MIMYIDHTNEAIYSMLVPAHSVLHMSECKPVQCAWTFNRPFALENLLLERALVCRCRLQQFHHFHRISFGKGVMAQW